MIRLNGDIVEREIGECRQVGRRLWKVEVTEGRGHESSHSLKVVLGA